MEESIKDPHKLAKTAKEKKEANPKLKKEENEVGGNKLWVLIILIISIIFGLFFSLKSGRLSRTKQTIQSSPAQQSSQPFNLDWFGQRVYNF
jgi:hypothetical protein